MLSKTFQNLDMKKAFIAAALLMSMSVASFAQTPSEKPAKKEKMKTEKPASDSTKAHHHDHKPAAKKAA